MATTYNFPEIKRGDSFDGVTMQLDHYLTVATFASLPVTGVAGIIYYVTSTYKKYKWVDTEYIETTDSDYIDLTGATIVMQIKAAVYGAILLQLSNGLGITITDAANGKFRIDPTVFNLPEGVYVFDIQISFLADTVRTYISGTIPIYEGVTHV